MRANEIIRGILDLIDGIDSGNSQPTVQIAIGSVPVEDTPELNIDAETNCAHDDIRRFKQIVDLADNDGEMSPFSNSPNEKYAGIEAVTTDAGGGMQAPKHPSDIRGEHPSMYPGHQHGMGE